MHAIRQQIQTISRHRTNRLKSIREFTLTIFGDRTITLKGERTGNQAKDLAAMGIKQKIQDSLDLIVYDDLTRTEKSSFNSVLNRNVVIVVENPKIHYNNGKVINWNTISLDVDYLSKSSLINISDDVFISVIDIMSKMDMTSKANSIEDKLASLGNQFDNSKETIKLSCVKFKFQCLQKS